MCILLSPWLSPRHLAYTNLSKSGTLLQAPTLVHKLHTSQVFAYKVRLGVYPPLTLALSRHLAYTNLSKSGTLLWHPTLMHMLRTPQVFACKVGLGVYPPLTLSHPPTPSWKHHKALVISHKVCLGVHPLQGLSLCQESVSFSLSFRPFRVSFLGSFHHHVTLSNTYKPDQNQWRCVSTSVCGLE